MSFSTINPFSRQLIGQYQYHDIDTLYKKSLESMNCFYTLQNLTQKERSNLLLEVALAFKNHQEELAQQITLEMGKPKVESLAEIKKSILTLEYYAELALSFKTQGDFSGSYSSNRLHYEGLGPILLIMPWNFPIWQVVRVLAPALVIGNSVVLKHSDLVAGVAELLEKILSQISIKNILINVRFEHTLTEKVLSFDTIKAVTVTGSVRAGRQVAQAAGAHIKKTVLELGGNDAYVIMPDCDLQKAVLTLIHARMINCGQSCIGPKRIFIHEDCYQEVNQLFLQNLSYLAFGDPLDSISAFDKNRIFDFRYGPLAHNKFKQDVHNKVQSLIEIGAKLQLGGELDLNNNFYPVTYLKDVDFLKFDEEIFGPVFCVTSFKGENKKISKDCDKGLDEVMRTINKSQFGLAAGIFSSDQSLINKFIKNIEVGTVVVNDFVRTDATTAFGGVKNSGFGRELGLIGVTEFANIKSVLTMV